MSLYVYNCGLKLAPAIYSVFDLFSIDRRYVPKAKEVNAEDDLTF
jgi:hypothetical protein